jgi:hypothetical protein
VVVMRTKIIGESQPPTPGHYEHSVAASLPLWTDFESLA